MMHLLAFIRMFNVALQCILYKVTAFPPPSSPDKSEAGLRLRISFLFWLTIARRNEYIYSYEAGSTYEHILYEEQRDNGSILSRSGRAVAP